MSMTELPTGTVTFLFTDIEGSTQLLKRLGPAYSGALAEHQEIVRAAAAAHHGREVDTQGDSFFIAFRRGKDAVAAAVAIQRDLAAHAWPEDGVIKVRIGLHTGEPQVGEERYVGMGVNKAARIGAAGHGGQVLLSRTTRDLVEDELPPGVTIRDLGDRRLKDIERPEHLFQLDIDGLQSEFAQLKTLDVELKRKRRRMYAGAALIGVLAAAVAIPVFALGGGGGGGGSAEVKPNSLAIIDPNSNKVTGSIPNVGTRPSSVTAGSGSIWVANLDDETLTRVSPTTESVERTFPLDATPTGIAFGRGSIWIANGLRGSVSRFDPSVQEVTKTIPVTERSSAGSVAFGEGAVWAVFGNSIFGKIDPGTNELESPTGIAGSSPSAIAVGEGYVWVANSGDNKISQILPETVSEIEKTSVGRQPYGVAVGDGAVWVTNHGDDNVTRYDVNGSSFYIPVGKAPIGIAFGEGSVWVANADDGTVSRIDPVERKVVETIGVGGRPYNVVVSDGRVWVTVQAAT
jgi:YVTN family beta-propeller protein